MLSNLWSGQSGDVAPQSGFPGTSTTSLSNGLACFRYTGPDGVLEYQWRGPQSPSDGLFGTITLRAQAKGDTPVTVPLANTAALSWSQAATAIASGWLNDEYGLHALADLQRRLHLRHRSRHRPDARQDPGADGHLRSARRRARSTPAPGVR